MSAKLRFSHATLAALRESKGLRICAGVGPHHFIGIWVVVVRDRVFVRSWSVKPNGWYRTFLKEPRGSIQVGDRTLAVRAIPIKSESLRDAIDRAYLDKYNTAGALKYAKDLGRAKSRDTTIEFVPLSSTLARTETPSAATLYGRCWAKWVGKCLVSRATPWLSARIRVSAPHELHCTEL